MKIRSYVLLQALVALHLIASPTFLDAASKKQESSENSEGYTINFDNVPIQEFLKYISKITGVNVIYNETDLNFNVTIVSEEQTDLNNVLSALVQILRIHGLTLIEEEKNLLIHKNDDVRQIPTVVSAESPLKGKLKPAIMTKVFRIQKGNPSHIAALIIPMLSKDALVEVSTETRQLIITDVSSSIQTIEQLLLSLDAPETPYDVDAYAPKFAGVTDLALLAKKILAPIADATTLEIIPQPNTQTIYIVSTPFLIDKALAVLQDLDKQSIATIPITTAKNLAADNVLVYKLKHKSSDEVEADLIKMVQAASSQNFESAGLNVVLTNMKYIQSTNSLMFVGAPQDLDIIGSFLKSIDSTNAPAIQQSSFLVYNIKHATEEQLRSSLHNLADYLETGKSSNESLILAIDSMRWIKATNSLLFTGHASALKELSDILPSFDVTPEKSKVTLTQTPLSTEFLIYSPKLTTAANLKNLIMETAARLKSADLSDPAFLKTLESVKELPSSNQLIFTGDKNSLDRLKLVLESLDQSTPTATQAALQTAQAAGIQVAFFHVQHKSAKEIVDALHETASKLAGNINPPSSLIQSLKGAQWMTSTGTIIVSGSPEDLQQAKELITANDVAIYKPTVTKPGNEVVFVPALHRSAKEIVSLLRETADTLNKSGNTDTDLIQTLKTADSTPNGNTVILSGTALSIQKAQELVTANDVAIYKPTVSKPGNEVVFVPVLHRSAKEIVSLLRETADTLNKSGNTDTDLIQTLKTADSTPNGNTVILSGTALSIQKAQELVNSNDVAIYKPTVSKPGKEVVFIPIINRSAKEVVAILRETAMLLSKTSSTDIDADLIQTLKTADSTPNGNTIILSGSALSIKKAEELITSNDTPQKITTTSDVFVYKTHYLSPQELKATLLGIAEHANNSNPSNETTALLRAVDSMRTIPESNAVQFVAPSLIIAKIKDIILILDVSENAKSQVKQQLGTNFLVYRVKYLNPQDLLNNLKQIVKEAPNQDSLLKSISGAQYSAGSNSIIFTGNKADLDKIQILLESLDQGTPKPEVITKIAPIRQAEGYKIYKPSHVPGTELISMVKNFEQHLVASGVTDQNLAEVIDHLSYLDRTNTLILTGKDSDIDQVVILLKEFDTQETASGKGGKLFESGVETIDDTGFLIYKLQHQSGVGIVQALTVISSDLGVQTSQKKNTSLVEAIRSTQWIEPTNSLIATGQPRVLTKLRELIQSIDQPLKQVFIEILVVESSNNDDLEFGLSWGSQGAVHNRFSWGGGNWNQNDSNGSGLGFPQGLNGITATNLPTGQDIPPVLGGFLGVIGDVIWHKGKSYASLGSLVKAFRTVATITEVLSQKIVAQDNQNAKIFSGSNIPFTGSLVTTSGLSQTTNANLEYRNVGITLSITPIIGDNDIITLDIDYELSEQANQGTGSGSNITNTQANSINGITTTKTSMQTKVHMPDRHFLVLSGTMSNSTSRINNGIPCLGGLPLVGSAFSMNNKVSTVQNVIIFVKPHIIKSQQIFSQITKEQEEIFGNKSQTNPEDFQNGLELIRSASDIDNEDIE